MKYSLTGLLTFNHYWCADCYNRPLQPGFFQAPCRGIGFLYSQWIAAVRSRTFQDPLCKGKSATAYKTGVLIPLKASFYSL